MVWPLARQERWTVPQQNYVTDWEDAHRYSPAPRHRRRLIMKWIRRLRFADCLDAGCAQPYLLEEMVEKKITTYGCDISHEVIQRNKLRFPRAHFERFDLSRQVWPDGRKFDLVVCSEVLEHVEEWPAAVGNLAKMCRRYLMITVPSGKIHAIDRHIGHLRHFSGQELCRALQDLDFEVLQLRRWGWPFHSFYKYAINGLMPGAIYHSFGEQRYGLGKKLLSQMISIFFYLNDFFPLGSQLLILAQHKKPDDCGVLNKTS